METEGRKKRLNEAVTYLISLGLIDGKCPTVSISNKMNRNSNNISTALRGEKRYLNRKFIRDFCATYKNLISEDWLWEGIGEMTNTATNTNANGTGVIITEESLMKLSREQLVFLVKQLMTLHSEQTEMYRLLIRQNEEMIRNGQERFNNISSIIYKNV